MLQPYMTLNRGATKNSNRRGSLKSLSSQRRASSSTSSTQGRLEDRAKNNCSDIISDSLRVKLLLRNNFTTLDLDKYTSPRKMEIPSIIKEESKVYSSQSRSRSDMD